MAGHLPKAKHPWVSAFEMRRRGLTHKIIDLFTKETLVREGGCWHEFWILQPNNSSARRQALHPGRGTESPRR